MSYRVLTGRAIPFVHALPSGLGAEPEAPAPGSWREVIFRLSEPFAQAASQRIAYGRTDPYYSSYGAAPQYYPGQPSPSSFSGIGGISPSMLLLGGAAVLAMMMLRK